MRRKFSSKISAVLALLNPASLLLALSEACSSHGRSRNDVLSQLSKAQESLKRNPEETGNRKNTAQLLYESGDFWNAEEAIQPLLKDGCAPPEVLTLAAELAYLLGHYEKAEGLYKLLLTHPKGTRSGRIKAKIGLLMTYYQTNRFDRAREIELPRAIKFPHLDVLKSFEQAPYRLEWHGDRITEVPFLCTDPSPIVSVEYNGISVHALFDTGADMCIIDTEIAQEMKLDPITSTVGSFGAGKRARIDFAKLRSLKIGGVTLHDIPVMIIPTRRFSDAFPDKKISMGGIIGTALLRQFLTTIDYANEKMVLRERSRRSGELLRKQLRDRVVTEIPFALCSTHLMMAGGAVNGHGGLTFFVDSGLASEARLTVPLQTLRHLGISEPERKVDPTSVGGGGGVWASALFPIETLGLGNLLQKKLKGEYGSRPASSYWENGFIQDGLISHGFFRQYASWTIDFDSREYLFSSDCLDSPSSSAVR